MELSGRRVSAPPAKHGGDFSGCSDASLVWARALESSIAETLHDRARNSMDSVGVSGGGHVTGSQLTEPSSSFMFSSLFDAAHLGPHKLADTATTKVMSPSF